MIAIQNFEKVLFWLQFQQFIGSSIFGENSLERIHALLAVFETNIEMSPYESKQVPK